MERGPREQSILLVAIPIVVRIQVLYPDPDPDQEYFKEFFDEFLEVWVVAQGTINYILAAIQFFIYNCDSRREPRIIKWKSSAEVCAVPTAV